MRKRTRARELSLQILYQLDLRGEDVLTDLDDLLAESGRGEDVQEFARGLVLGTARDRDAIDERITAVAAHWDVSRMATIDRNILRMAVFEMLERPDIPVKVTINEAIELAKKYSTQQSGAFVNGILDRLRIAIAEESKPDAGDEDDS